MFLEYRKRDLFIFFLLLAFVLDIGLLSFPSEEHNCCESRIDQTSGLNPYFVLGVETELCLKCFFIKNYKYSKKGDNYLGINFYPFSWFTKSSCLEYKKDRYLNLYLRGPPVNAGLSVFIHSI